MKEVNNVPIRGINNGPYMELLREFLDSGMRVVLVDQEEQIERFPAHRLEINGKAHAVTASICSYLYSLVKKHNLPISVHKRGKELYLTRKEATE